MQLRRLKNVQVDYISLVNAPANGMYMIFKSAASPVAGKGNGEAGFGQISKSIRLVKFDQDLQVAYGIVYAPEEIDTQGDFMDSHEIQAAAYRFMKEAKTGQVDREHTEETVKAYVAESWIVKAGDPYFYGINGAWAVGIKVEDPEIWAACKSGEINGLSMAGTAETDVVEKNGDEGAFKAFLQALQKFKFWKGETDMDVKELGEKVVALEAGLPGMISKAVEEAIKKAVPAAEPAAQPAAAAAAETPVEKAIGELKTSLEGFKSDVTKRLDAVEKARETQSTTTDPVRKSAVSDGII